MEENKKELSHQEILEQLKKIKENCLLILEEIKEMRNQAEDFRDETKELFEEIEESRDKIIKDKD